MPVNTVPQGSVKQKDILQLLQNLHTHTLKGWADDFDEEVILLREAVELYISNHHTAMKNVVSGTTL